MSRLFGTYYWMVTGRHNPSDSNLPTFQTAPELWSIWSIFFALLIPWAFWASTGHQTNKQGYKALIAKIIRHWYINLFWLHFSLINIFASVSWLMMRQCLVKFIAVSVAVFTKQCHCLTAVSTDKSLTALLDWQWIAACCKRSVKLPDDMEIF